MGCSCSTPVSEPSTLPLCFTGGETVFPNVAAENTGPGWSACARHALAHKPQTGDLILFWSLDAAGEVDMGTTHTACPVLKGEKWSAPLWIRQSAFQPKSHPNAVSGDSCDDTVRCAA